MSSQIHGTANAASPEEKKVPSISGFRVQMVDSGDSIAIDFEPFGDACLLSAPTVFEMAVAIARRRVGLPV